MTDRHHLLECILWPNGDGTFRKIINTQKRLESLGIYDDYKMTISIDRSIHQIMHAEFKKGTEYSREGDKHPLYGRTGENHQGWKGDKVTISGMYHRANKLYKSGEITEEEFQPYRDAWSEYIRERKLKCQ